MLGNVRLRSKAGFTLVEILIAMSIFALLSIGGLGILIQGINSWNRDYARGSVEADTGLAMRKITAALRPAINVTVDSNGQGISYNTPLLDASGNVVLPIQSDGTQRRIYRSENGTQLLMTGTNRPLLRSLAPASDSYNDIFATLPSGKAVAVNLVSTASTGQEHFTISKTEVVDLRNMQ